MYQIKVNVKNSLGAFNGYLQLEAQEEMRYEEMLDFVGELVKLASKGLITSLVMVLDDGTEMAFPEKVLRESIVAMKLLEIDE